MRSGIMASAVLAAIGITLARPRGHGDTRSVDALAMSGLILLFCAAFEFAVIGGEKICNRAATANLRAGTFLAGGSIAVVSALVLLSVDTDPRRRSGRVVLLTAIVVASGRMASGAIYTTKMMLFDSLAMSVFLLMSAFLAPILGSVIAHRDGLARESVLVKGVYLGTLSLVAFNVIAALVEESPTPDGWESPLRRSLFATSWTFALAGLALVGWFTTLVASRPERPGEIASVLLPTDTSTNQGEAHREGFP